MTPTRREFLVLAGAGVCAASLGMLSGCASIPSYKGTVTDGRILMTIDEYKLLAGIEHPGIRVDAPTISDPLLLIDLEDGNYRALSSVCTHQACEVRFGSDELECPCHGSTFTFAGKVTRGPAKQPLPIYPVHVENGTIEITVDRPESTRP